MEKIYNIRQAQAQDMPILVKYRRLMFEEIWMWRGIKIDSSTVTYTTTKHLFIVTLLPVKCYNINNFLEKDNPGR